VLGQLSDQLYIICRKFDTEQISTQKMALCTCSGNRQ